MANAILYGLTQEVLKNLGSRALKGIASTWGFSDDLERLKSTVDTINDVLLDAEDRQVGLDDRAIRGWLQKLSMVVYEADDLFDEFNTIASSKKLLGGNKVSREVRTFFSRSNQIAFAFKLSRKIKSVREMLEAIRKDGADFGLAQRALQHGSVIARRRDETPSYVDVEDVIGRDDDMKTILDLLLTENEHEHEPVVLPIVGIGGMGKTTLAQAIFTSSQVEDYFDMKLWVCVAEEFQIKVILEKILRSATKNETPKLDLDQVHSRLRDIVGGKKYLLVLDDVWEDNPNKWEQLKALLKIGRKGSKILVTTRSSKVADIMGTLPSHELQGLSEEKSWALFENMAFKSGDAQQKPHLVAVGKILVKRCANVPLAIKTLGGLLRCEDESKWLLYKDKILPEVMDVLKFSYQNLPSPLKNCFVYCALFPKDYVFDKEKLIKLWMAEGFITDDNQSLEDIAEDYFFNLLQRGFFQDVRRNMWGNIESCKMHDLIHDLAQEEAKAKCMITNFGQIDFNDTILHLSFDFRSCPFEIPKEYLKLKLLRTFIYTRRNWFPVINGSFCQQLVTMFHYLRVLDLYHFCCASLPDSIGKLIHLRYLNLSYSEIETLPHSVTNLFNLQTLNLQFCHKLKVLPTNIKKLANLRSLDVSCCDLSHMPLGLGDLTLLHDLPTIVIGRKRLSELKKNPTGTAKLSDLKKLNNLRGSLSIRMHDRFENNMLEAIEANLSNKHCLSDLKVFFDIDSTTETNAKKHDEAVLEGLKPNCNLKDLTIHYYKGEKLPSWGVMHKFGITLPYLVRISLSNCESCQELPYFSQLLFLKFLELKSISSVEYMESEVECDGSTLKSEGIDKIFFPSLETLELRIMKNLKGWWKEVIEEENISDEDTKEKGASSNLCHVVGVSRQQRLLSLKFHKLSKLIIYDCPNLIYLPFCPNLDELTLESTNKKLSLLKMAPTDNPYSCGRQGLKIKRLEVDDVEYLISLLQLGLHSVSTLILKDEMIESTERLGEASTITLQRLKLRSCNSLRSISNGLENLTALDSLVIFNCKELDVSPTHHAAEKDFDLVPWKSFKTNLRHLELSILPKVVSLPRGIQHLKNLCSLDLKFMEELKEIPEWISCLSSLQILNLLDCPKLTNLPQDFQKLTSLNQLYIKDCPGLTERCRSPNGTDWPNIRHIPRVIVEGKLQIVEEGANTITNL